MGHFYAAVVLCKNFANKKKSMRMTQTRNLWSNTGDLVIKRNAALLKLKTNRKTSIVGGSFK